MSDSPNAKHASWLICKEAWEQMNPARIAFSKDVCTGDEIIWDGGNKKGRIDDMNHAFSKAGEDGRFTDYNSAILCSVARGSVAEADMQNFVALEDGKTILGITVDFGEDYIIVAPPVAF